MKQLKLFNGRGYALANREKDPRWANKRGNSHVSIAAYSRADAERLIQEYTGYSRGAASELKDFFSQCWGNSMKGITPERGIWVEFEDGKPERVL